MKFGAEERVPRGFEAIADLFQEINPNVFNYRLPKAGGPSPNGNNIFRDSIDELVDAALAHAPEGSSVFIEDAGGSSEVTVAGKRDQTAPLQGLHVGNNLRSASTAKVQHLRACAASSQSRTTTFESCEIGTFSASSEVWELRIVGGVVGILDLTQLGEGGEVEVFLEDCVIFQLKVGQGFNPRSLTLTRVAFTATDEKLGSTLALRIYRASLPKLDRTSFGYLGEWARKTGSSDVAHIARGCELAIETTQTSGLYRIWLFIWGLFSNYGLDPVRPLVWLFGFAALNTLVVCWSGSEVGLPAEQLRGWRAGLIDGAGYDGIERAIVSSIEGLTSPLSGLSGRRLVVPTSAYAAAFQVAYGFASLGLLSFCIFSLRRRFKV